MSHLAIGLTLIGLATLGAVVAAVLIFFNSWESSRVTWGYALMLGSGTTGVFGFCVAVVS